MTTTPLTVTALVDGPTSGLTQRPVILDGPLAWAAAMTTPDIPPITHEHAPDMDLPLARWDECGTWGWCASQATLDIRHHGATELRRKPHTAAMSRYTGERKHHLGLGPHKARDTVLPVEWVHIATWHVLATDQARLEALLTHITHLGSHRAIGLGEVQSWTLAPDPNPQAWRDRPMPTPGAPAQAYRAPYWHPSRRYAA